ncbi:MFS transporter [Streptomyces virginiae]|uniref:MFS transporter n=1 Tax=Streptomyces virginiae TaxID=1961 RepID=A0ABQ3NGZ4_STRVG|nr:MFS transporter [Streptomyces virginiae]MBP2347338.1 Na+/melibiose symporter-like transporter [Streptomyces virginiae]GGQ09487.1 MFS transporter [Streptomyces virginiae]GHI12033.1 MFS transporter [Streptomyces virginiae]
MATTGTARTRGAPPAAPAPRPPAGPPARLRFGYASGSLVTATFTTLPGLLLLPYLTDTLGVGAALAGLVVFVPKAWDALLNPLVGRASDRTRTRWGARRPYVLWGGLAMAAAFALTFAGPLPGTAGAWFTAAGYLLTATAFAFFQVPYVAMPAELVTRDEDRMRLVGGRVAVIGVAALVTGAAAPALIDAGGGGLAGHRWAGVFGAVVIALGAVWVFAGTSGSVPPARVRAADSEPGLRRQFAAARANPSFAALLWCAVVQSAATGVLLAGAPYFADHVLRDSAGVGPLVVAFVAPNLLTLPLWSRLRGRRGHALASALFAAGCLLLLAAPVLPDPAVLAVMALAGTGHAGQLLFLYAMLAQCIARTERRRAGVLSGLFTTGEGLGVAAGPFVYGLVLQLSGYVSSGTGRAAEQTATAELGLLAGFAALPALATAAAVVLLRGYDRPPAPTDP